MIQGDGFFVVRKGNENVFTRAGAFSFDETGQPGLDRRAAGCRATPSTPPVTRPVA